MTRVLRAYDVDELQALTLDHLRQGWKIQGGVSFEVTRERGEEVVQTVVKVDEHANSKPFTEPRV